MKFFTSVQIIGGSIYHRYIDNGVRHQIKTTEFSPSLFYSSGQDSEYKDLYGKPLQKQDFNSISDCKEYVKSYSNVDGKQIYGTTDYTSMFMSKTYPGQIEWSFNQIKIFYIDIEVSVAAAFPDPMKAEQPVTCVTIYDSIEKHYHVFGIKNTKYRVDNMTYYHCGNEENLLKAIVTFWASSPPDIVTGWHTNGFDIPYLINRITNQKSQAFCEKLSPWNRISSQESGDIKARVLEYDILGIELLDMLDLYKKFVPGNQESYSLDYIAKKELGRGKVQYDGSLQDLYENDYDKYVEYNIADVELVIALEQKLSIIALICNLGYKAKINYGEAMGPVKLWSNIVYHALWEKKIIMPPRTRGSKDAKFEGAYVKEPKIGMHDNVVTFDATSMYPSNIMAFNISPETMVLPHEVPADLLPYYRKPFVEEIANWARSAKSTAALRP